MKLLFVNDDGIDSPFLRRLYMAAKARGHHVTVCAPAAQQSTTSHHYHTGTPVTLHPRTLDGADAAWAVEGTPVDCVRIALRVLCKDAEAVLSGINLGYNTGWPVFASGTVGAAREAVFSGVPALAVSAEPRTPEDTLDHFAAWTIALAEHIVTAPEAKDGVWNINAPCVPLSALQMPVMCGLHPGIYRDAYACTENPDGSLTCRMYGLEQEPPAPGSDLDLLNRGHITCTLLQPDSDDQQRYASLLHTVGKN